MYRLSLDNIARTISLLLPVTIKQKVRIVKIGQYMEQLVSKIELLNTVLELAFKEKYRCLKKTFNSPRSNDCQHLNVSSKIFLKIKFLRYILGVNIGRKVSNLREMGRRRNRSKSLVVDFDLEHTFFFLEWVVYLHLLQCRNYSEIP